MYILMVKDKYGYKVNNVVKVHAKIRSFYLVDRVEGANFNHGRLEQHDQILYAVDGFVVGEDIKVGEQLPEKYTWMFHDNCIEVENIDNDSFIDKLKK